MNFSNLVTISFHSSWTQTTHTHTHKKQKGGGGVAIDCAVMMSNERHVR